MGRRDAKRLISLFAVLAMAVTLTAPAAAAEDNTAGTMRLESAEGTVTVKNASGLSVKLQDKMRLYDGYTIQTAAKSYAYVSLDGAKSLKLDADSEASVSKSGKKLEITLVSGSLFVNVNKPLENSESLNIRTSTMVTGVRGTSACVSAPTRYHTEITLLTGRLEVTGRDSHSGEMETVEMVAGERVVVAQEEVGTPEEHLDIRKLTAQEVEVPGFAAVEVAKDPELQGKITAETELSVPLIIGDAEERLAADQEAAEQAAQEVRQQLEQQEQEQERRDQPQSVDPVFRVENDDDDDDDGGSSGGSGGGQPTVPGETVTLTAPTQEELQAALYSDDTAVINLLVTAPDPTDPTAGPVLRLTEDLTIPQGKTLNLLSGTLCNEAQLTVMGTLRIARGTCLTNTGCLNSDSGGAIYVHGSLMNIPNNTPSTLDEGMFFSGMTNVSSGGEIVNAGNVDNSWIVVYGRLDMNGGTVSNYGNFEVYGSGEVHGTALLTDSQFNNNGNLTIGGTMTVVSGTTLNNGANGNVIVISTNSLHIAGTMINAGGLLIGLPVDDVVAPGLMNVSGTLELQGSPGRGTVRIDAGSVLEIRGELKVSGTPELTVRPGNGYFHIRENASYQLFKLEPGPTEAPQAPVGGYYIYTNSNEPPAGDPSDMSGAVAFRLKPTGTAPEPEPGTTTHTVTFLKSNGYTVHSPSHETTRTQTADSWVYTVKNGDPFTYTMTAQSGYEIQGRIAKLLNADGSEGGQLDIYTTGTEEKIEGITGNVKFTVLIGTAASGTTHTVTFPKVAGLNGVTSPDGTPVENAGSWVYTVPHGSSFMFKLDIDPKYRFNSFNTDGEGASAFGIRQDLATGIWTIAGPSSNIEAGIIGDLILECYITQTTASGTTHTVTFPKGDGHYTISTSTNTTMANAEDSWVFTVADGGTLEFRLDVEEGYMLETPAIDMSSSAVGAVIEEQADGSYVMHGPSAPSAGITGDVRVALEFVQAYTVVFPYPETGKTFTIAADSEAQRTVDNNSNCVFKVAQGTDFVFAVTPNTGCEVTSVTCDGETLTPDENEQYTIPKSNTGKMVTVRTGESPSQSEPDTP